MAGIFPNFGSSPGMLGGLPDWLWQDPQATAQRPNAMAGGTPAGSFEDRWGPVMSALQNGQFDPQGGNQTSAYGGTPPQAMAYAPQGQPPIAGMPQPQQPPQAPAAGGYGGDLSAPPSTIGAPTPQGTFPTLPQAPVNPGIGDRLNAGLMGFANSGGPLPAIANLISGLATGQRQDPQGQADQTRKQAQAAAYQAVKLQGGSDAQALAAASNPDVFKALAPDLFGAPKVVQTGESIGGGKQFMLQKGSTFSPIPGGGAAGAAVDAQGQPLQGPAYLEYIEKKDPSAAAMIKGILRGDAGVTGRNLQHYMPEVQRVDPTFSQYTYDTRKKTALDFAPSGKSALNVRSLETVGGHIDKMLSLFDNLGNTWQPEFNTFKNWLSVRGGKGEVNAFETAANGVANELGTVFRSFGMSDAEVKSWRDRLSGASSPEQFQAGMSTLLDMLKTRKEAIAEQYKTGLGKDPPAEMFQKLDAAVAKIEGKLSGKGTSSSTEAQPATIPDGATATNPKTGEKRIFKGGKWVPVPVMPANAT